MQLASHWLARRYILGFAEETRGLVGSEETYRAIELRYVIEKVNGIEGTDESTLRSRRGFDFQAVHYMSVIGLSHRPDFISNTLNRKMI